MINIFVSRCGATYTTPSGTLTSPNYPNNYPSSRECIWQIISAPGTNIRLTINVFDVEHHSQCKLLNKDELFKVSTLRYIANRLIKKVNAGILFQRNSNLMRIDRPR